MGEATNQINDTDIFGEAIEVTDDTDITPTTGTESPEEIRARIEQTRSELGGTLDALQEKLDPERLKEQAREQVQEQVEAAKESVKEATIGKAGEFMQNVGDTISEAARPVVETVGQAAHTVGETVGQAAHSVSQTAHNVAGSAKNTGTTVGYTVSDKSSSLMDTIKQNPIPAAMAAFGIGWLILQNGKTNGSSHDYKAASRRHSWNQSHYTGSPYMGSSGVGSSGTDQATSLLSKAGDTVGQTVGSVQETVGQTVGSVQETAGHLTHQVGDQAQHVTQQAQHKAHDAQDGFQRALQDSPLAVGAVALAVGAAIGLSLPSTQPEGQLMGEAKQAVMDKASHAAQDTLGKVKEVAGQVVEEASLVAKIAAEDQGLTG